MGVRASNDKLSSGLENPYSDVANEVQPASTPANTPAAAPATSPATPAAPARPKQVKKKKQFTAPFPIPLSELKDYVGKKKKETYKEGNGFLFDYEVSQQIFILFLRITKWEDCALLSRVDPSKRLLLLIQICSLICILCL